MLRIPGTTFLSGIGIRSTYPGQINYKVLLIFTGLPTGSAGFSGQLESNIFRMSTQDVLINFTRCKYMSCCRLFVLAS